MALASHAGQGARCPTPGLGLEEGAHPLTKVSPCKGLARAGGGDGLCIPPGWQGSAIPHQQSALQLGFVCCKNPLFMVCRFGCSWFAWVGASPGCRMKSSGSLGVFLRYTVAYSGPLSWSSILQQPCRRNSLQKLSQKLAKQYLLQVLCCTGHLCRAWPGLWGALLETRSH